MADPIISVVSQYNLRRTVVGFTAFGWAPIVPANASRWSIRFVMGSIGLINISPFPTDETLPGFLLNAGETIEFYLSREPSLVGVAWWGFCSSVPFGSIPLECWECTPVGT